MWLSKGNLLNQSFEIQWPDRYRPGRNECCALALGIYLTSQERFDEAMQIYETALQKSPDDMGITYQVGRKASQPASAGA